MVKRFLGIFGSDDNELDKLNERNSNLALANMHLDDRVKKLEAGMEEIISITERQKSSKSRLVALRLLGRND